jgi:DNA polymerase III sliding clamp (beta) subunit (PCNA family)
MKINKYTLLKQLESVKPGLANTEIIEQSNTFGFHNGKIVTYNDSISIQAPTELNINGAVNSQKFYSTISKLKSDKEGNIEINIEDGKLIFKSKKANAGLVFQSDMKLPIDEINLSGKWRNIPDNFLDGVKICSPSVSKDFSKPVITCINIDKNCFRAGDGFRLTKYNLSKKTTIKCSIPSSSLLQLLKYDITQYMQTNNWMHFTTADNVLFSCRLINDNYPDVDHLFNVRGEELIFPDGTTEVIQKADIFSTNEIADDSSINVTIKNKKLIIKGENQLGWYEEKLKIKSDLDISFDVNPKVLTDILKNLKKCIIDIKSNKILFVNDTWQHIIVTQ